ncbi:T9SS type A sorting domain-containing protein [Lacinutrix sp. C3R15]|uniref:T9SS type A sorting domain-containing protein n=1 Tax=Flavobacteriaceae TaxID=49546 RepID=UPI001C09BD3B|nr:T9SS type A sorting domain-containing protein [Oceanihabitans sp. 1_MG-2023]MBU2938585.1 T9SS type A sorting domain-containing protein [Lacinutrix sp. C3R15]MDO6621899.1 T9SS type A sorting domain-containing protein [Oceanihabitans sp. 1_MG-2023]
MLILINSTNLHSQTTLIPDSNFEQALISLNIDTNGLNGNILNTDAIAVTTLFIGNIGVNDLSGIEAFKNLVNLFAYNNQLISIDLSFNPYLEILDLDNNNLSSLNLNVNTDLKSVYLSNNNLNSLDVSNNLQLEYLSCNLNNLNALDLSVNTALKDVRCYDNNLSNIDISTNTNLEYLFIAQNNLTSLDLSANTALKTITCDNNSLNNIDLSNNVNLRYFSCSNNNLSNLNLSTNSSMRYLLCNNNNLTSLAVNNLSDLFLFYTQNNQIQEIDISNNPDLKYVRAEYNLLNTIDVRNGNNHRINEFVVTNNENLNCVFVDNTAASYLNNWEVGSSCNFVADESECQTLTSQDFLNVDFAMYPNPASSSQVTVNLNTPAATISLYTVRGQFLLKKPLEQGNNTLDISRLSTGLYIAAIKTEDTTVTKKLIIQ